MEKRLNPVFIPPAPFKPTEEQVAIQISREKAILIEANAGAAKTTTLAFRIGETLARGVKPDSFLVLTFTKEAKDVMCRRLMEIGIPWNVAKQIRVETFEEFSASVLYQFDGVTPDPKPLARDLKPYVLSSIRLASDQYNETGVDAEFSSHSIAISQFIDMQMSIKARMIPFGSYEEEGWMDIASQTDIPLSDWLLFKAYESQRCRGVGEAMFRGPFDATYDLAKRLEEYPELRSEIPLFRAVLCDELHDLNEAAFRILTCLISHNQTYFVGAGDKDQVIYSTLGADSQFLDKRFKEHAPNIIRLPLTASYRYGPQLAISAGNFKAKKSTSALGRSTEICVLGYNPADVTDCPNVAIQAIKSRNHSKNESVAILLRDRHQSIQFETALIQRGIPYETLQMRSFLLREEILFLRGLMAIALNDLGMVHSISVRKAIVEAMAIYCELDMSPTEDYPNPLEDMHEYLCVQLGSIQDFLNNRILTAESTFRYRVSDALKYLAGLEADSKADVALGEVCRILDLESLAKRLYVHPYEASIVTRSIAGFIELACKRNESIADFVRWIGQAEETGQVNNYKGPAIILDCISNVKGMEFDHVLMPYLEAGQFPDPQCEKSQEENLFYVGITRAKHVLTLLVPEDPRRRSPFVDRMDPDQSNRDGDLFLRDHVEKQGASPIDLRVPYEDKDKARKLGAYWDPVRKVWYIEAGMDPKPFGPWLPF